MLVMVAWPGYLSGVGHEWDGVVRRGAKLLHAFAEAVVPRVTLVTRKAFGGAYIAMNSRSLGATQVFAWPDAEVAVMGLPSDRWGGEVPGFVVLAPGAPLTVADLISSAREQLAEFKCPRAIHFIDSLPLNAMGKVQRNRLVARDQPPDAGSSAK